TAHHYDLRLEVDGVMRSWAVPKGPSMDPAVKRLAVEVEDHAMSHNDYEGARVIVWDRGTYEQGGRVPWPEALERGHAVFVLHGEKLLGGFALQRTRGGSKPQWLLIKRRDDDARPGSDVVAQRAGPGVELDRRRGHEAAAGQHPAAVVGEPAVDQREQARDAGLTGRDRVPHLAGEVCDPALEGRDLQFLLAAEQAVQAALA